MAATVNFKTETAHAEGSYSALVSIYGLEFALHYINGEVRAYGTSSQSGRRSWQVYGAAKLAREAAAARIAALGPEFQAAHEALYADEVAA